MSKKDGNDFDLENLYRRANEMARFFDETTSESKPFRDLLREFQSLQSHPEETLQKIGRLAVIFEGQWSQRQWLNLLVPLERYLDRRLSDPDIIGFLPDQNKSFEKKLPLIAIADHWRSAFNIGALFRIADGFGISKIYLTGYSPTPMQASVLKTAMGSIDSTPWEHVESTLDLIHSLHSQGIPVWALETTDSAAILGQVDLPSPLALVLGNERFGIDPRIIDACRGQIKIPLRGFKNSMNVANCFGIFAYEWCRQHG